jgi:hypothetical protein
MTLNVSSSTIPCIVLLISECTRLCLGSLLGAVRESGSAFQSIPWEHDADVCYLESDQARVAQLLPNMTALHHIHLENNIHARFARLYVDMFPVQQIEAGLMHMDDGPPRPSTFPRDIVFPLAKVCVRMSIHFSANACTHVCVCACVCM